MRLFNAIKHIVRDAAPDEKAALFHDTRGPRLPHPKARRLSRRALASSDCTHREASGARRRPGESMICAMHSCILNESDVTIDEIAQDARARRLSRDVAFADLDVLAREHRG